MWRMEGTSAALWTKGDDEEAHSSREVCDWTQVWERLCTSTYRITMSQLKYSILLYLACRQSRFGGVCSPHPTS